MKKLLAFILVALALPAFGQRVTLTVTVTNKAATGDGITVNGGLRYFTNATKATTIATNLTSINATKTNLFNQFAAYPWSGLTLADGNTNAGSGTNSFRVVGSAISASLTGTWGYLTLSTQAGSSTFPMLYPLANVVGETNRTNQASDVVAGLNSYATNTIATNATPLGNYLTKGASTQQVVIAPVQFNGALRAGGGVALTNGFARSVTNISPVTSNLVNYGNAIRSEGSGGNSLQVGSNAVASGALSMALGNGAAASGANSTALGVGASATNTDATAVGTSASAAANAIAIGSGTSASGSASISIGYATTADAASAVSIGNGSTASAEEAIALGGALAEGLNSISIGDGSEVQAGANNSIAVGAGSIVGYSNSVAIGYQSAATTTNQVRLGNSDSVLSVPGFIRGTLSNLVTAAGQTNVLAGDLSTPIGSITTVANGANRINMGTQSVVNITGSPTATWSIDGVIFGTVAPRDGHRLHIRNNSGYNATLAHNSGLEAVAGYRLSSPSGVDLILTNGAMAQLVYSAADSRWLVWSVFDGRLPAVGATNAINSIWTNGVAVASSSATNLNIIYGSNMVFRATNINGQVDLHISSVAASGGSTLSTNANQFGADAVTLTIKDTPLITNLWVYGNNTNALRINSGVITSSLPALDISQTWSNAAASFTAFRVNATNFGSGSSSLIADFQTNGTSHFFVSKDGDNYIGGAFRNAATDFEMYTDYPAARARTTAKRSIIIGQNVPGMAWASSYILSWSANTAGSADGFLNRDLTLSRDSAATLQLGTDAATTTTQTIKAHDGSGTDKAGATFQIRGGQSTGTGVGGAITHDTSLTGTTGSSANSYSTREYIYAGETTLTEGAATGFVTIALPASKYAGVHVFLTTHADDATDFQATTDMFTVSAVAKGTNISSNVQTPTQSTIASTGTLTTAITVTSTTNNTFTVNCNATSSLTQTTLKAKWQIRINSDAAATVTPL